MIQNKLFRECLAEIPEDRMAEFELSFAIAERIVDVLKQKGMTRRDLANKLGKRESEISKWLTGRHNFTISQKFPDIPVSLEENTEVPGTTSSEYRRRHIKRQNVEDYSYYYRYRAVIDDHIERLDLYVRAPF